MTASELLRLIEITVMTTGSFPSCIYLSGRDAWELFQFMPSDDLRDRLWFGLPIKITNDESTYLL